MTCKETDVIIVKRGTRKHHTMWMEGSRCNRIGSIKSWENFRIRYNAVEESTIDVEKFDVVLIRTPTLLLVANMALRTCDHLRNKYWSVFMNT